MPCVIVRVFCVLTPFKFLIPGNSDALRMKFLKCSVGYIFSEMATGSKI